MRDVLSELAARIMLSLLGLGVLAGIAFGGYYAMAFFSPRYEAVRRETVEQSKAFRDGALRNIRDYQARYLAARSDGERDALRAAIEQELTSYDEDNLPADLCAFVRSIRG